MKDLFSKLFPSLDYLYIFQLLEYKTLDFLVWFLKNPSARNLQRKGKLDFTKKAILLFLLSFILILISSITTSLAVFQDLILAPIFFLFYSTFSPIFIIIAQLILLPFEIYSKYKIINLAKAKLKKYPNLKVIAVVGSFAKTSTKNMLYTLLWKDFIAVKTPKSYNTHVSIANSILELVKENTQVLIVEMDAYRPNEIKELCQIAKPSMGIITAIAAQHLSRFGSMGKLAKAQFEIAKELPKNGLLFLNAEDEWTKKLEKDYSVKKIFFGGEGSDFYATDIKQTKNGLEFLFHTKTGKALINLPLFGTHHISNFLAASAVAYHLGLSTTFIKERAKLIQPTKHRLEIREMNGLTIIDNSYNTNPTVSRSSLKLLAGSEGDQKILITPGLIELGDKSFEENKNFAQEASKVADEIIIVGENAKEALLSGLKEYSKEKIHKVSSTKEAMDILPKITKPNSVVLIENDLPDQYF